MCQRQIYQASNQNIVGFFMAVLIACRVCAKMYMRVFYAMHIFTFQLSALLAFRNEINRTSGRLSSDTNMQAMNL